MTTMLEKMARRMAASVGNDPAWLRVEGYVATAEDGVTVQFYDGVVKGEVNMLTAARAALLAIREPTADVIDDGARAASSNDAEWRVDDVTPFDETDSSFRSEWRGEAGAAFTAMIDAILNEKT